MLEWIDPQIVRLGLAILSVAVLAVLTYWLRLFKLRQPSEQAALEIKTLECRGWNIRYHQSGRGPDLILIHGIGANLFCWRDLVPRLKEKYRVLALDLPGFGKSSKNRDADYGLDHQVERLADIMSQLSIHKAYIVGNSMGGNIALWMALRYPERVRALSLIAPALNSKKIPFSLNRLLWLSGPVAFGINQGLIHWTHRRTVSRKDRVDAHRVGETLSTYVRQPDAVRSFMLATSALRDKRLIQQAGKVQCPVQILWGSKDLLVNNPMIRRLEKALPAGFESHVHLGGGHHLQEDEPDWVTEKIDAFFGQTQT
jgi:pimeloyl-ACP methyl ester carboxylesterase